MAKSKKKSTKLYEMLDENSNEEEDEEKKIEEVRRKRQQLLKRIETEKNLLKANKLIEPK